MKRSEPEPQLWHLAHAFLSPLLFASTTVLLLALWTWPQQWILSGSPVLYLCLLLGDSLGYRALGGLNLWVIFTILNLSYAICSTSWLLHGLFTAMAYGATGLVCLAQFRVVGDFVRKRLRAILRGLHFVGDKVAFFDIPALEIDTDVDGLFVIRGLTFSFSSLCIVAHGVEVGIKLSNDMELAIQCEKVEVKLFRRICVGDCFVNLKGGEYEMTFGKLAERSKDRDGNAVFVKESELLKAASFRGDSRTFLERTEKMTSVMTGGKPPKDSSARSGFSGMESLLPADEEAASRYHGRLSFLQSTDAVHEARTQIQAANQQSSTPMKTANQSDSDAIRAEICSVLHHKPSVPHPPKMSVKVTTLQNLTPPWLRRFLHRLPMLLRLLLGPLSYFHPVHILSITTSASGAWIDQLLVMQIFRSYHTTDSQIARLKERLSVWLSHADFVVELADISGHAQVPFFPTNNIYCRLDFEDVMAYRFVPKQRGLKQVVRLGGADASFTLPSFLLPHHEHLLPPKPNVQHEEKLKRNVVEADGKPKKILAERELKQARRDEANVRMSVHARLPACFDQELLDFIAALVKATKVVEMAKKSDSPSDSDGDDDDEDTEGGKHKVRGFFSGVKGGMERRVVDGVVNDHWIAKLVGKISKRLEAARGEAGYSGDIPVKLSVYRTGAMNIEGKKLLP